MPKATDLSDEALGKLLDDRDAYNRLLIGPQCPTHRQIDRVVNLIAARYWKTWDTIADKLDGLAEEFHVRGWVCCEAYVRLKARKLESER